MAFEWTPDYLVHIQEIDVQHEKLFELIVALENSTQDNNYRETVRTVLEELMEYVNIHFDTEEDYMSRANYQALDEHREIHNAIREEVNLKINEIYS